MTAPAVWRLRRRRRPSRNYVGVITTAAGATIVHPARLRRDAIAWVELQLVDRGAGTLVEAYVADDRNAPVWTWNLNQPEGDAR